MKLAFDKETPGTLKEKLYALDKEKPSSYAEAIEWGERRRVLLHELAILEGWVNG